MQMSSLNSDLLDDLPRGKNRELVGTPPHAYFEAPANLAATASLRFDSDKNPHAKLFLGVAEGEVIEENASRMGGFPAISPAAYPLVCWTIGTTF